MSALFPDTRPEAERVEIELLRQAPAWRKLEMVGQLNQTVRTLALSGLRPWDEPAQGESQRPGGPADQHLAPRESVHVADLTST